MERISITTACFATNNAISKTALLLHRFMRQVRELRAEMDQIIVELHSLDTTIDLIKEDAGSLPLNVASCTPDLLESCAVTVNELGAIMSMLCSPSLPAKDKKMEWIVSRKSATRLRSALHAHKLALGLAIDLITFSPSSDSVPEDQSDGSKEVSGPLRSPVELPWLPADSEETLVADAVGKTFLASLQAYAGSSGIRLLDADAADGVHSSPSENSGLPDSAIEMNDSPTMVAPSMPYSNYATPPIYEVDESPEALEKAPTPPPKDESTRALTTDRTIMSSRQSALPPIPTSTRHLSPWDGTSTWEVSVPRRTTSLRLADIPSFSFGRNREDDVDRHSVRRDTDSMSVGPNRSTIGRFMGHVRNKISSSNLPSQDNEKRPSTGSQTISASEGKQSLSVHRSASRRLSATFKNLQRPTIPQEPEMLSSQEPDAVFGVTLAKSMEIASAAIRTRHNGSGGETSSRRFPLCIAKCTSYLKEKGLHTVDIFSTTVDDEIAMALQVEFSRGPLYGKDVDLDRYGPVAAADLVTRYLSLLRRPLVSESVARRWVKLSRRATIAGMAAMRSDDCIDFWEEALRGARGPVRNTLKLLLGLWGDVVDHADSNEMTAERLAGSLVKPLMHTRPESYETDLVLGLAFMIRKRAEYTALLQEGRERRSMMPPPTET